MSDFLNNAKFPTFVDVLRCRSLEQPSKLAFSFLPDGETDGSSLTYKELDQQARSIAARLQSLGVNGERALLLYRPGLEYITALFGCLYAGLIAVPAYLPRLNQSLSRLQAIVADARATIALTNTSFLSNIERRFEQFPNLQTLHWLATDDAHHSAHEWQEPAINSKTQALLLYTSGSTDTPKGVMLSHGNLLNNSAIIDQCFQNTPDSKGVSWLPPYHDMGLIGGILQPIYVGASMIMMSPINFLQRPIRWLEAISRYEATISGGPNFAYDLCVRRIPPEQRTNLDLSSWEIAFNGAESVRAETLEQFIAAFKPCGFRASSFYSCYGMAEASLLVSGGLKGAAPVFKTLQGNALEQNRAVSPAKENDGAKTLVGCGQTWGDVRVAIVHPETLARCHPDEVGEIWVSGGSIAQGYWNQPHETQRVFQAFLTDTGEGPFLRTGDLGFVDNGELFVTGRIKDLIIIRGRNHYPQDIEKTVEQSHPALRAGCSAAFSVDVNMEERLVVVVEVDRQHLRNLDRDAVIKCIRQAVTEQHDLEIYTIWLLKTGSIPKTSSGKIQHHACRKAFLNNSLDVVGDWTINPIMKTEFQNLQPEVISLEQQLRDSETQPSSADNRKNEQPTCYNVFEQSEAIAAWLISKITDHLKISNNEIDIREPFSVYGLDSISIVNLSGQLENWLGCQVSPTVFYDYPTIEALAQHLEAMQREALLAKVDHLSEEEVDLLLQKLLKKESS